jgi:spermidine/putrescine transport system substrate-binding protein
MSYTKLLGITSVLLGLAIWLAACAAPTPAAPTLRPTATVPAATELNIFNWDTFIDPQILTDFEQKFGVKINYTTYDSNEELLQILQAGSVDYDLIVPSDYMTAILRSQGRLAALDKDNIPNARNIDPALLNTRFDPGSRYCMPYQWGTMGIGYNRQATGKDIRGWKDFFDPAYAGRVALLDDGRAVLGVILIYLGYSPNTTNLVEIQAARDFLLAHKHHIKAYAPDTGQDLLDAGEVDLVFESSGDIFQLQAENPDVQYIIPEEGSLIGIDFICILASAPHQELAEAFINYLLEPEVGAQLSNYVQFASPNQAALPFIAEADRSNPNLYPSTEMMRRLFYTTDLGAHANQVYNDIWAEILADFGPQD